MKKILPIAVVAILLASCNVTVIEDVDPRDDYTGTYTVTDACDAPGTWYTMSVYKDESTSDEIVFGYPGLYEINADVHAIVTGSQIYIPIQRFYVSQYPEIFYEFSGNGTLEGSTLIVDYRVLTVQEGYVMDDVSCTAYMTR